MKPRTYQASDFTHFEVTGTDTRGRRFKRSSAVYAHANSINLYRGTLWGVYPSGRRVKLKTVWN